MTLKVKKMRHKAVNNEQQATLVHRSGQRTHHNQSILESHACYSSGYEALTKGDIAIGYLFETQKPTYLVPYFITRRREQPILILSSYRYNRPV